MHETNRKIKMVQSILKDSDIDGCITGSSLLDKDFDEWDSVPDVDLFVYREPQLLYACDYLTLRFDFEPLNDGEAWKLSRIKNRGMQRKAALSTVKLVNRSGTSYDGIIVNITFKKNRTNMFEVLSSFDMSIIMRGYDIPTGVGLDLTMGWDGMIFEDPNDKWSIDSDIAVPNPLRKQDLDMYSVEMWVRQFDRVVKYWNRGFDTRPMARFYLKGINAVMAKGALFKTSKATAAYEEFVSTYGPIKDKIEAWLKTKED